MQHPITIPSIQQPYPHILHQHHPFHFRESPLRNPLKNVPLHPPRLQMHPPLDPTPTLPPLGFQKAAVLPSQEVEV